MPFRPHADRTILLNAESSPAMMPGGLFSLAQAAAVNIDRDRFIAILTERFPVIAAGIDDCGTGLLHSEMGTFAHATNAAITGGDAETVRSHFNLADELFRDGNDAVQNAVLVSYLENLDFDGPHAASAREMLSPTLTAQLIAIERFWNPEQSLS